MALKFLRRGISLAKRAAFWERAAFDCDPDLKQKLERKK